MLPGNNDHLFRRLTFSPFLIDASEAITSFSTSSFGISKAKFIFALTFPLMEIGYSNEFSLRYASLYEGNVALKIVSE